LVSVALILSAPQASAAITVNDKASTITEPAANNDAGVFWSRSRCMMVISGTKFRVVVSAGICGAGMAGSAGR